MIDRQVDGFMKNGSKLQFFKCLDLHSDDIKLEIVKGLLALEAKDFEP